MSINTVIKFSLSIFILILFSSCTKDKKNESFDISKSYILMDVSYGESSKQEMDIYLPANRSSSATKTFVLVHGGAWSGGDKSELTEMFNNFKTVYSDHAIINLNYRLGTPSSPGYPKQMTDIQKAIAHIQQPKYKVSSQYFFIGVSAGGHLSMLYSYVHDVNHNVKGICNIVGPADLTDPSYDDNPFFKEIVKGLVGQVTPSQNPQLYAEVSPAKHISAFSPKTISFFGGSDELIPSTQLNLLHERLNLFGVYNEATLYPNEGHGNWNQQNTTDFANKLVNFINTHFN